MTISAGKLRHRLSLQRRAEVQDPVTGAITYVWQEIGRPWGQISPLSAREFIAAQTTQSRVSARITIRYRSDIDAKDRLVHNGKAYNIEGILADPDSGLEYLTVPVSEGVNDG